MLKIKMFPKQLKLFSDLDFCDCFLLNETGNVAMKIKMPDNSNAYVYLNPKIQKGQVFPMLENPTVYPVLVEGVVKETS